MLEQYGVYAKLFADDLRLLIVDDQLQLNAVIGHLTDTNNCQVFSPWQYLSPQQPPLSHYTQQFSATVKSTARPSCLVGVLYDISRKKIC